MANVLIRTSDQIAPVFMRAALGPVMLAHGMQAVFGLWGGAGWSGTIDAFAGMGMPTAVAVLVMLGEFLGGLGLVLGLLTRIAAAGITVIMAGAVYMAHWQHGFFMNWFGQQSGEGFEYHLLTIGLGLSLVVLGGGRWSVDRAISRR